MDSDELNRYKWLDVEDLRPVDYNAASAEASQVKKITSKMLEYLDF